VFYTCGAYKFYYVQQFLMLMGAGMAMSDPPPPYSVVGETKINNHIAGQLPGSFSFNPPPGGQAIPHNILPVCPPAPPGYETVAYYPALSSGDAAVFLQPQPLQPQQPQTQVITIVQQIQPTNAEETNRPKSRSTDVCLACCLCMCCTCPCILVSFM